MSADLNRVILVGRLTRDPELRRTRDGDPVCAMRLAVTGRARDEAGHWADRPNFFDVTAFGHAAETAAAHLAKGRRVGIDGRLAWREWDDADGGRRQAVEVVAADIHFLDPPRKTGAPDAATVAAPVGVSDDDVPF
jgi:single-strand DNA-binding protein